MLGLHKAKIRIFSHLCILAVGMRLKFLLKCPEKAFTVSLYSLFARRDHLPLKIRLPSPKKSAGIIQPHFYTT